MGKRNYRYFFTFVSATCLFCLLAFIQTIIALTRFQLPDEVGYLVMNIILLLYAFAGLGFTGVLLCFHVFLSVRNTTTNEFCKDSWETISGNPFAKYHYNYPELVSERTCSRSSDKQGRSSLTPKCR